MLSPLSSGKVNGRNGPSTFSSTSLNPSVNSNNSGHHSKQRALSPLLRDEDKRRNHDDKWKSDNTSGGGGGGGGTSGGDKIIRDRAHNDRHTRAPPYDDHSVHDASNKHSLSSRLSKTSRAPSLEYVRKNATEPPVLSIGGKKKLKDKPVDKVSSSQLFRIRFIRNT